MHCVSEPPIPPAYLESLVFACIEPAVGAFYGVDTRKRELPPQRDSATHIYYSCISVFCTHQSVNATIHEYLTVEENIRGERASKVVNTYRAEGSFDLAIENRQFFSEKAGAN